MNTAEVINFPETTVEQQPFPYFYSKAVFSPALEKELYKWLNDSKAWKLTQTEFYEQYEFSLFDISLPPNLNCLIKEKILGRVKEQLEKIFKVKGLEMAGATVHKLTNGQRIGIHNDFIGKEESHRLLVQINADWTENNGGYLLLFNSPNAEDISDIIIPVSNSAFGFEISRKSNHAVSTVYNFSRYTLVYTFKQPER